MNPLLLFCAGAGLTLMSVLAGVFIALWSAHVARTGASPLPSIPRITLFNRKEPEDDDGGENGRESARHVRVGP